MGFAFYRIGYPRELDFIKTAHNDDSTYFLVTIPNADGPYIYGRTGPESDTTALGCPPMCGCTMDAHWCIWCVLISGAFHGVFYSSACHMVCNGVARAGNQGVAWKGAS